MERVPGAPIFSGANGEDLASTYCTPALSVPVEALPVGVNAVRLVVVSLPAPISPWQTWVALPTGRVREVCSLTAALSWLRVEKP